MIKPQSEVIDLIGEVRGKQSKITAALKAGGSVDVKDIYELVESINEIIENVGYYMVLENNEADGVMAIKDYTTVRDGWVNLLDSMHETYLSEVGHQWVN